MTTPPPPPSMPVPSPAGAQLEPGEAVSYGWRSFWKFVGPMLLITLVIVIVHLAFSIVGSLTGNQIASSVISIIGAVVGLLLALGLIRASLAVTRGDAPVVEMLFQSTNFGAYFVGAIIFGIAVAAPPLVLSVLLGLALNVFGVILGLVIGLVISVYIAVIYGFFGFVIVDRGVNDGIQALKDSAELTAGRRGEILLLGLLLLGVNFVGALLCGIGLLFTEGISAIAWAYAYRKLAGEPVVEVQ